MPKLFHVTPRSAATLGDELTFARQLPASHIHHAKTPSEPASQILWQETRRQDCCRLRATYMSNWAIALYFHALAAML
jgi:hypothetical protein